MLSARTIYDLVIRPGALSLEGMGARALSLPADLARLVRRGADFSADPVSATPTGIDELDALLPDRGLPRGAVSELCAPRGLGFSTSVALALCARVQEANKAEKKAADRVNGTGWCAFVDPSSSLHGQGVDNVGVDRERLLVVRPSPESLTRIAVRMASSRAFDVLVIDTAGVPGAPLTGSLAPWATVTRRLAMTLEGSDRMIVLLTAQEAARPLPLPVALRVELAQPMPGKLSVNIPKERHGRVLTAAVEREVLRSNHDTRAALSKLAQEQAKTKRGAL